MIEVIERDLPPRISLDLIPIDINLQSNDILADFLLKVCQRNVCYRAVEIYNKLKEVGFNHDKITIYNIDDYLMMFTKTGGTKGLIKDKEWFEPKKEEGRKLFEFIHDNIDIDFEKELNIDDFIKDIPNLNTSCIKVCDVVLNPRHYLQTKNGIIPCPVKFVEVISKEEWEKEDDWLYFVTLNKKIVKIGGTSDGLNGRMGSYTAGVKKNRKKGTCSTTNFKVITNIEKYLKLGVMAEIYAERYKPEEIALDVHGDVQIYVPKGIYKPYEASTLTEYKKLTGRYPILNRNTSKVQSK